MTTPPEPAGAPPEPVCVTEVAAAARRVLPAPVWDYLAGGSGGERTLRANRKAFDRFGWSRGCWPGVEADTVESRVVGTPMAMPVAVAPMTYQRWCFPRARWALTRALHRAGVGFIASMLSSEPIERVAGIRCRGVVPALLAPGPGAGR